MGILQRIFDKTAGYVDRLDESKAKDAREYYAEKERGNIAWRALARYAGKEFKAQGPGCVAMFTELAAKIAHRPLDTSPTNIKKRLNGQQL